MSHSKRSLFFAVALAAGVAQAATFEHSSITPGQFVVREIVHPLAPQQITQNTDPNTLVGGTSAACSGGGITTDNHWWRLFDLDDDHALLDTLTVASLDYGIETAVGPTQNITATMYCLDEGLPFELAFLTQVGINTVAQPDAELEFFNIAVGGSCDTASQDLAVDMSTEDCLAGEADCLSLFIGANDLGQSGPTYVHADDCGIFDPVDTVALGFFTIHIVYVVNGEADGGDPPQDDGGDDGPDQVPASTGVGVTLMILALLGTSAYVLRRRVKS